MVPFQGQGILFAFHACLFAVILFFLDTIRISASNAPPCFLGHTCRFALSTMHSLTLPCSRLKCVGQQCPHALPRQLHSLRPKCFFCCQFCLRCSPDTPDRSQGYQSGQCPCTQSGRIFVFACLCVILMCLGAVGVLFVCSHACFYMFHRPWVSACP